MKTRRINEKKNQPYVVKTHRHVSTSFALMVHYLIEVLTKENEYFVYRGEDCTDVFTEKFEKIIYNFANFPKQKMIFTEEDR